MKSKYFRILFGLLFICLVIQNACGTQADDDKDSIVIPLKDFRKPEVKIDFYNYKKNKYETYEGILDTGCGPFIAISAKMREDLGLVSHRQANSTLADGSLVSNLVCNGKVCFYGQELQDEIYTNEKHDHDARMSILIGTGLIKKLGRRICFDPVENKITIGKLQETSIPQNISNIEDLSKYGILAIYSHVFKLDYLEKQLVSAKMSATHAFNIISDQNDNNFLDRAFLVSRQQWLGGADNSIAFKFKILDPFELHAKNKEAYNWYLQYDAVNKAVKEAVNLKRTDDEFMLLSKKYGVSICFLKQINYENFSLSNFLRTSISIKLQSKAFNVSSEYFEKQCDAAGLSLRQSSDLQYIQTPDNFYDRVILGSRQQWLGGPDNNKLFTYEKLTNRQAYNLYEGWKNQGYKPIGDFPTKIKDYVIAPVASLFGVDPKYFEEQCESAGRSIYQAIYIIDNPTSGNFYDRIILGSRQQWLGDANNGVLFKPEGLTNSQAYKYLFHENGEKRNIYEFYEICEKLKKTNGK